MTEKKVLQTSDLLKIGVYEDTGQKDREDKRVIRVSFSTLAGKMTVKNELINYLDIKKKQLIDAKKAAENAALTSHQQELNKINSKLELLNIMIVEVINYYKPIDVEFKNRLNELDDDIKNKVITDIEGNTLH